VTAFIVFTFAGPLMAFGDIAPGERRVGVDRPGRSALLGLIAAGLGLRREDPRQQPLAASLAFAVRVDATGEALVDYHTAQTAPSRKNRRFATRREELAIPAHKCETILSQRAYRADAAFTVAALPLATEPFGAEAIIAALAKPALPIHAGRRACPLGLPPSARLIEAADLPGAFAGYDVAEDAQPDRATLRRLCGVGGKARQTVSLENAFLQARLLDPAVVRRETRRDDPFSRVRWQFGLRDDFIAVLGESAS